MILYAIDRAGAITEHQVPFSITNIQEYKDALQMLLNDFTDDRHIVVLSSHQIDCIKKHDEDDLKPF